MWRQGDQEQYERSPEDDTLAEEGASGNLIEGSNPQKGCLNHAGEADMPCHSGIGEKARKRRGKEQSGKCLGHPRGRGPRGCRGRGGQDGRNERRKVQATEYAPNEDASNDNKDSSQDDTMNGDNTDENATVHQ
uniref:Uncharacterized protein LOC102805166 n=1 Tax=Saccoglossus kowalevskii TaxID=10224 RepID=A0ABM0MK49_SACKO|nr:PREDICTED: uncharacterized protein LOC102805166 [Saccoglossus kowalevskii]